MRLAARALVGAPEPACGGFSGQVWADRGEVSLIALLLRPFRPLYFLSPPPGFLVFLHVCCAVLCLPVACLWPSLECAPSLFFFLEVCHRHTLLAVLLGHPDAAPRVCCAQCARRVLNKCNSRNSALPALFFTPCGFPLAPIRVVCYCRPMLMQGCAEPACGLLWHSTVPPPMCLTRCPPSTYSHVHLLRLCFPHPTIIPRTQRALQITPA